MIGVLQHALRRQRSSLRCHFTSLSHGYSPYQSIPTGPYGNLSAFVMERLAREYGNDDQIAFIDAFTNDKRSCGELRDTAFSLAISLRNDYGLEEGDTICLYSPNHIDYPAVILACGLLGLTITPANPLYTANELERQLHDSCTKFIISHSDCKDIATSMKIPLMCIDEPEFLAIRAVPQEALPTSVDMFPNVSAGDDALCCLPYSSGTTGLPKGTIISHNNLVANLHQMDSAEGRFYDSSVDVLISPLPMFHIYGYTVSVLYSIWKGVPVVTMPKFDMEKFCHGIERHSCTRAHIVPPIILGLAKEPVVDKYDMSSFKVIMSAAAPLSADVASQCAKRLGCIVKQGWGMSELSPLGTVTPDDCAKPESERCGSIGVLVASTEGKIVDPEGNTVPVGKEGEFMIRGPQVLSDT